jgi:hypothetical protein
LIGQKVCRFDRGNRACVRFVWQFLPVEEILDCDVNRFEFRINDIILLSIISTGVNWGKGLPVQ